MKYQVGEEFIYRKRAPVPDSYMRPIRGNPLPALTEPETLSLEHA